MLPTRIEIENAAKDLKDDIDQCSTKSLVDWLINTSELVGHCWYEAPMRAHNYLVTVEVLKAELIKRLARSK